MERKNGCGFSSSLTLITLALAFVVLFSFSFLICSEYIKLIDMGDRGSVSLVKKEGERLLDCLKDSNLGIITCLGWKGIGRWRIANYAAKIAKESQLFDVILEVNLQRNDLGRQSKLQMKIAESLGIHYPTAEKIGEELKDRKFLLVIGGVDYHISMPIDLEEIGVPNVRRGSSSSYKVLLSKVIFVGKWENIKSDQELSIEVDIDRWIPSPSNVWGLFCEEVAFAANSPLTKGYFSVDTVLDCLLYSILSFNDHHYYSFAESRKWRMRYLIAEELIDGEMEKDKFFTEAMNSLMIDLADRSIIVSSDRLLLDQYKRSVIIIIARLGIGIAGRVENFRHRFWIESDSLPKEENDDDDDRGWRAIQRMSLIISSSKAKSLPLSPKCPNLSTLILRYDGSQPFEFPPSFFHHMERLRVLDLSFSPIESLPSSLSSLSNLKLLALQSCTKLESLPISLQALTMLEHLVLSGCVSLKAIPNESFELMNRLQVLDLSKTQILSLPASVFNLHNLQKLLLRDCSALTSIEDNCFLSMSCLRVLDLSNATSLESLPSSLSSLINLKKLNLSHCTSLKTGVAPQSLQNLTSLEVLDLSYCVELEDIRDATFERMSPKLEQVRISNTQIPRRLSFRSCKSIKTLNLSSLDNLEALELLDLSDTELEVLDLTGSGSSLKYLDIFPLRCSDVLSKEQNWGDGGVGARIWVSDPDFFGWILECSDSFFDAACFSRFYIRISPYEEKKYMTMTMDEAQSIHLQMNPVVYKHIYSSHSQTHLFPHLTSRSTCSRHLEICGDNSFPQNVDELFAQTELITVLFNDIVETVSELWDAKELQKLKECRIGNCECMENIFSGNDPDHVILTSLEVIWASDLPELTTVCHGVYGGQSFAHLKHIYLKCCPKLATLFTSGVYLESLETLEIRFCSRLENVIQQEVAGGKGSMQNLRSLCLFHVPKLKSVCNSFLPQLEMVKVLRCPKLRKLPIQVGLLHHRTNGSCSTSSSLQVPEIRGEMEWWKNLEWDQQGDRDELFSHFRKWDDF